MNINKHVTTVPQEDYEEMMKAVGQPNVLANASSLFFAFMVEREATRPIMPVSMIQDPDRRKILTSIITEFKAFCTKAGWTLSIDYLDGMVIIAELKKTEI